MEDQEVTVGGPLVESRRQGLRQRACRPARRRRYLCRRRGGERRWRRNPRSKWQATMTATPDHSASFAALSKWLTGGAYGRLADGPARAELPLYHNGFRLFLNYRQGGVTGPCARPPPTYADSGAATACSGGHLAVRSVPGSRSGIPNARLRSCSERGGPSSAGNGGPIHSAKNSGRTNQTSAGARVAE